MKELRTEIEIDASSERVWTVLSDFSRHAEWNPFIRVIEGEPREGERLSVRIEPPGGKAMRFRPTVLRAVPSEELRWLGRLGVPGPSCFSALEESGCWYAPGFRANELGVEETRRRDLGIRST